LKIESGEHLKPRSQYAEDAVQLAIAGKWDDAVKLNKFIIDSFGADEEAQNRLGKALSELGKLKDAKSAYEAALKLNPMNSIAKKNAARINTLLHQKEGLKVGGTRVDLNLFVEEMGKTVITTLESSSADICSKVAAGDVAELKIEGDGIVAETSRGVRLGLLEAKLARRLIKFMRGGNRYQAGVTSCDGSAVKLIVRETYQDPRFAGKPCGASARSSSDRTRRRACSPARSRFSPRMKRKKGLSPAHRRPRTSKRVCTRSKTRPNRSTSVRMGKPPPTMTTRTTTMTARAVSEAWARRSLHRP